MRFDDRGVFPWRSSGGGGAVATKTPEPPGTWRLFGSKSSNNLSLLPPAPTPDARPPSPPSALATPCHRRQGSSTSEKQFEDLVASSIALIQHDRPSNLPAKCGSEAARHRAEHARLMEAARRRAEREAAARRARQQEALRHEEALARSTREWVGAVLPDWRNTRTSKRTMELWWSGLPPSIRGKVWQLSVDNKLNVTTEMYGECVARARGKLREAQQRRHRLKVGGGRRASGEAGQAPPDDCGVELIQLDIARTFPHLCIFQPGGPYFDTLRDLLSAYVCLRPDVGYVQGMSFLGAMLILNMEAPQAFVCFANLLDGPVLRAAYTRDGVTMQKLWSAYSQLLRQHLPALASRLAPELYLLEWLYTAFAKAMPLDCACRVWDLMLRDGDTFLLRTALGVLHLYQDVLKDLDFIAAAQFLTKLPEDLCPDALFRSISAVSMTLNGVSFEQLVSSCTVDEHADQSGPL